MHPKMKSLRATRPRRAAGRVPRAVRAAAIACAVVACSMLLALAGCRDDSGEKARRAGPAAGARKSHAAETHRAASATPAAPETSGAVTVRQSEGAPPANRPAAADTPTTGVLYRVEGYVSGGAAMLPGAEVLLHRDVSEELGGRGISEVVARGTTDALGHFVVTFHAAKPVGLLLRGRAEGFAPSGGYWLDSLRIAAPGGGNPFAAIAAPGLKSGVGKPAGKVVSISKSIYLGRPARLAGHVRNGIGEPIAGAVVRIAARAGDAAASYFGADHEAMSGADGAFALESVAADDYTLLATAKGFAPARAVVNAPGESVVLTMGAGGAGVAGRVFDQETGKPIGGARVIAMPEQAVRESRPQAEYSTAVSDSAGAYRIEGLEAGAYLLRHAAAGYYPALSTKDPPIPCVALEAGETELDFDLYMDRGRTVRGVVIDAATDRPIADARVIVWSQDLLSVKQQSGEVTLADGTFERKHVQAAPPVGGALRFRVSVSLPGWQIDGSSGSDDRVGAGEIEIHAPVEPRVIERRILMTKQLTLTGKVVDRASMPVAGASVGIVHLGMRSSDPEYWGGFSYRRVTQFTETTDANGDFRFPVMKNSAYAVHARKAGLGQGIVQSVAVERTSPEPVVVKLTSASVQGIAMSADGPVSEAQVLAQVMYATGGRIGSGEVVVVKSGPDGRFRFDGLPAGSISISASKSGYAAPRSKQVVLNEDEQKSDVVVEFQREQVLAGRVLLPGGEPAAGVAVSVNSNGGENNGWAKSDSEGKYRVVGLAGATALVRISESMLDGDTLLKAKSIDGVPIPNEHYDITLEKLDLLTLTAYVVDGETRQPVTDFEFASQTGLTLKRVEGEPNALRATIRPGSTWAITINAPGYAWFNSGWDLAPPIGPFERTLELQKGGSVKGRIVRRGVESGALDPVAGARVNWAGRAGGSYAMEGSSGIAEVPADEAGRFVLDRIGSGEMLFRISVPGESNRVERTAMIRAGETTDLGDIELGRGAVIKGRYLERGEPVIGVEIPLLSSRGGPNRIPPSRTDSEGRFEFRSLAAGEYVLTVSGRGMKSVVLRENEVQEVNLEFGAASISGRVTSRGKPIRAIVSAVRIADGLRHAGQSEPEAGAYQLDGLQPGTWQVEANALVGTSSRFLRPASETVTIEEGQALQRDFSITMGAIGGVAVDAAGKPVAGASVLVVLSKANNSYDAAITSSETVETAADGTFRVGGLGAGSYGVSATKKGVGLALRSGVEVLADADPAPLRLVLGAEGGGTLVSLVREMATGKPIQTAWCALSNADGRLDHGQERDLSGRLTIPNIPAGTYQLQVSAIGFSVVEREIVVEAGKTITFEDSLYDAGALRLTLQLRPGVAAAKARVHLAPEDPSSPELPRSGTTDAAGLFVARGMFPGRYRATAESADGAARWSLAVSIVAHDVAILTELASDANGGAGAPSPPPPAPAQTPLPSGGSSPRVP